MSKEIWDQFRVLARGERTFLECLYGFIFSPAHTHTHNSLFIFTSWPALLLALFQYLKHLPSKRAQGWFKTSFDLLRCFWFYVLLHICKRFVCYWWQLITTLAATEFCAVWLWVQYEPLILLLGVAHCSLSSAMPHLSFMYTVYVPVYISLTSCCICSEKRLKAAV